MRKVHIYIDPMTCIENAAFIMLREAKLKKARVEAEFNGILINALPNDDVDDIVDLFYSIKLEKKLEEDKEKALIKRKADAFDKLDQYLQSNGCFVGWRGDAILAVYDDFFDLRVKHYASDLLTFIDNLE